MKLAVIGGGSTYTPELIDGVLRRRDRLPISEITLFDVNPERLEVVAAFGRRMVDAAAAEISVQEASELSNAVRGASFVISQFRVGGQAARQRDEMLGREFGLIGQETVGVGGFAKGLRTIPVALHIADVVLREAPTALLLNFTNPAGMITEALLRHRPLLTTIGLCNAPWNVKTELARMLSIPFSELELDSIGLNHLSWVRGVRAPNRDLSRAAIDGFSKLIRTGGSAAAAPAWSAASIEMMNAIPSSYLLYYYERAAWLEHQQSHPTRASEVMSIEATLLEKYSDPSLRKKPKELMQRGGAYYSDSAAELMADIVTDAKTVHIVNTRTDGAVDEIPADWVMEIPCVIGADGPRATHAAALRPDMDALVRTVKDFELLTIEAAVHGNEDAALRALLTNPLGPDLSSVKQLWIRLKEENRGFLRTFDA